MLNYKIHQIRVSFKKIVSSTALNFIRTCHSADIGDDKKNPRCINLGAHKNGKSGKKLWWNGFYFFSRSLRCFFLISIPFFFSFGCWKSCSGEFRKLKKKLKWKPFLRCSEPGNSILYRAEEYAGVYTLWFFLSGFFSARCMSSAFLFHIEFSYPI